MAWQFVGELKNLPISVSVNKAYLNLRRGGRVKAPEYLEFERNMKAWAWSNRTLIKNITPVVADKILSMTYTFYLQSNRIFTKKGDLKRFDVSNYIKTAEDQIANALAFDDSRVFIVKASKQTVSKKINERIEVKIWATDDPEDVSIEKIGSATKKGDRNDSEDN